MPAITTVIMSLMGSGDHVLADNTFTSAGAVHPLELSADIVINRLTRASVGLENVENLAVDFERHWKSLRDKFLGSAVSRYLNY